MRGQCFASDRADWSKKSYVMHMYDAIYDTFVKAGVAKHLLEPVYQDMKENVVPAGFHYGELIDIKLVAPKYILFADKTDINTSSKDNGNKGGNKFICKKGQVPKIKSTTLENCVTVLPFTSKTGHAVLCAVIYMRKGEYLPLELITGLHIVPV